ncbi:battenin CLN3 protein [Sorochytrium milnesiophthora]
MGRAQNAAFFVCGLVNNFVYVVFLSAAVDMMSEAKVFVPKSVVLLACIIPALIIKSIVPICLYQTSYILRMAICVVLSIASMLIVAFTTKLEVQLFGIVLAAISSGLGESTFLALTSYFKDEVISYWSSGTGGAGLAGSWIYLLLTSVLKLSTSTSLLIVSVAPLGMAVAYMLALRVPASSSFRGPLDGSEQQFDVVPNDSGVLDRPKSQEIGRPSPTPSDNSLQAAHIAAAQSPQQLLTTKKSAIRYLIPRYLLPLFLVYLAEYTINQGILPTVLYPLDKTPFHAARDHYPAFQACYQAGVLISRSSVLFFRLPNIMWPSVVQMGFMALLAAHAITSVVIPSVYLLFCIIFVEGLIGGGVYVNCYWKLAHDPKLQFDALPSSDSSASSNSELANPADPSLQPSASAEELDGGHSRARPVKGALDKAFCFTVCGVADSLAITLAGLISLWLEGFLCTLQHQKGNGLCTN